MYVKVTFVGNRFDDFRVVQLLEFLDLSKFFMLKIPIFVISKNSTSKWTIL